MTNETTQTSTSTILKGIVAAGNLVMGAILLSQVTPTTADWTVATGGLPSTNSTESPGDVTKNRIGAIAGVVGIAALATGVLGGIGYFAVKKIFPSIGDEGEAEPLTINSRNSLSPGMV